MEITSLNLCVRCGKERIAVKTWVELGNFPITRTDTICPDKDCQKIVDDDISAKRQKKEDMMRKNLQEKEQRAKSLDRHKIL